MVSRNLQQRRKEHAEYATHRRTLTSFLPIHLKHPAEGPHHHHTDQPNILSLFSAETGPCSHQSPISRRMRRFKEAEDYIQPPGAETPPLLSHKREESGGDGRSSETGTGFKYFDYDFGLTHHSPTPILTTAMLSLSRLTLFSAPGPQLRPKVLHT